jgi:TonB family protein
MKRDTIKYRFSHLIGLAAAAGLLLVTGCGSDALSTSVRQDISAQIAKQRRPMASCYKKALKRNKRLKRASVTMAFTVDESGTFRHASLSNSSVKDARFQRCVLRRAKGLRVAQAPDKPVNVSYPLRFKVKVKRTRK